MEYVVSWVISCIAIAASLVIYLKNRRVKALSFASYSTSMLVNEDKPTGLRITYSGVDVDNPVVTVFRIRSAGNLEILESDFIAPMKIRLCGVRNVLSAQASQEVPEDLGIVVDKSTHSPTEIETSPLLLNPSDGFDLKILSDGYPDKVEVSTRIAGVKAAKRIDFPYESFESLESAGKPWVTVLGYSLFTLIGLYGVLFLAAAFIAPVSMSGKILGGLMGAGALFAAITILRRLRRDRALRKTFDTKS